MTKGEFMTFIFLTMAVMVIAAIIARSWIGG